MPSREKQVTPTLRRMPREQQVTLFTLTFRRMPRERAVAHSLRVRSRWWFPTAAAAAAADAVSAVPAAISCLRPRPICGRGEI